MCLYKALEASQTNDTLQKLVIQYMYMYDRQQKQLTYLFKLTADYLRKLLKTAKMIY